MDLYEVLKYVHIVAAIVWLGGAAVFNILVARIGATEGTLAMFSFGRYSGFLGKKVFMPSAIVVLLAGVGMVLESGWEFQDLWIALGLIGIVATVAIGLGYLTPTGEALGREVGASGGDVDPDLQRRIDRFLLVARLNLVLLFLIVLDMVVKPGA